jgi:hypothetical protein
MTPEKRFTQRLAALPALFEAMSPIVRPTMLESFSPDCCIATCRVLRDVFAEYGYRAEAIPVTVQVLNGPMQALLELGPLPDDRAERIALFNKTGAWGVGIGGDKPLAPGKYCGHLVLNVHRYLVDASIDQVSRPEHNMALPPLIAFPAPPGFFAAKPKGQGVSGMIGETLIAYKRLRDDSYRTGRGWREAHTETRLRIMRLLRERLAAEQIKIPT